MAKRSSQAPAMVVDACDGLDDDDLRRSARLIAMVYAAGHHDYLGNLDWIHSHNAIHFEES